MLNEALRLIRVFHDLKQTETALKLGVSKSYLSEIEHGHKVPTLDLLGKYEKAFDIPLSSIIFFSEEMASGDPASKAKFFVASKVLSMLQFIEQRSGMRHAD